MFYQEGGWFKTSQHCCQLIKLLLVSLFLFWPQFLLAQGLIFQELLPRPIDDQFEYIQIANLSNQTIDLAGWLIADIAKQNKPTVLSSYLLKSGQIWQTPAKDLKITLNDNEETLWLWSPDGQLIDTINYQKAPIGAVYYRSNDQWHWLDYSTSTVANSSSTSSTSVSISSSVKGLVTALPYQLSSQFFYITQPDNSAGLKIYCYHKLWPQLELGDLIEVTGQAVTTSQEEKINIKGPQDIKIISTQPPLKPINILTNQFNDLSVGQLVSVTGQIAAKSQSTLYLTDDFGEILIQLKTGSGLKNSDFVVGQTYCITGLVINNNGYRLVPRQSNDILNISPSIDHNNLTSTTTIHLTTTTPIKTKSLTWLIGFVISSIIGFAAYRLNKTTKTSP